MNENATVLTAHLQERRERILVAEGDTVLLRGTEFTISKDRYGYIKLTPAQIRPLSSCTKKPRSEHRSGASGRCPA